MAWRIHENVVRGEIDNRERGVVRGRVWLAGVAEPLELELKGNAAADLAGCLLRFENQGKCVPLRPGTRMEPLQQGTIGDLTASRRVRVLELPVAEAYERKKQGLPVPEHMANSLYLEWFSQANGRVVVESADFKLTISPPEWRLTPTDERDRQQQAASGFDAFMQRLSQSIAAQKHEPPEDKEWDEFDYEKFMRECDARTDKYAELLEKYQGHPDCDRLIAKEMGWTWLEEGEEPGAREPGEAGGADLTDEKEAVSEERNTAWAEEAFEGNVEPDSLEPDPATEGKDWVRKPDGHTSHPVAWRAFEGWSALWEKLEKVGLAETADEDIEELVSEYQITSAKLAGALNGLAFGRDLSEGAFIVACLKRALNHLHAAQGALEKVSARQLLPVEDVGGTRAELFGLREEILRLMKEFRAEP